MLKQNKKAGEKYLSIWWFFVLGFIGVAVIICIFMLGGKDINVKQVEAEILVAKTSDCVLNNKDVNPNFLSGKLNITKECGIDENLISKSGKYYLLIEAYNLIDCKTDKTISCNNPIKKIDFGVVNFKNQCGLKEGATANYYPECSEKYLYLGDKIIYIFAGSNQDGQKGVTR